MPLVIPLSYFFLLPRPAAFSPTALPASYEDEVIGAQPTTPYTALPTDEDVELTEEALQPKAPIALTFNEKRDLVKPLLLRYMLPLCKAFSPSCAGDTYLNHPSRLLPVSVYLVSFIHSIWRLYLMQQS